MFNLVKFLGQTKAELNKVTWPNRKQTISLTQTVIVVSLIVSLYLGFLDFIFDQVLKLILR